MHPNFFQILRLIFFVYFQWFTVMIQIETYWDIRHWYVKLLERHKGDGNFQ